MKLLKEFVNESKSIRDAAEKLKQPHANIFGWMKSKKKHFVIELDGELKVLAVK